MIERIIWIDPYTTYDDCAIKGDSIEFENGSCIKIIAPENKRKEEIMAGKYIKKPIVLTAIQWNGENFKEVKEFCRDIAEEEMDTYSIQDCPDLHVKTLEGVQKVRPLAWIVRGIKGEFYSVKNEIFQELYEEIEEE